MTEETKLDSPEEGEENQEIAQIYEREDYVTLFRYENPQVPYDSSREGIVSVEQMVGQWFTDNIEQFKGYIILRQPGGNIVVVRVPKADIDKYDAANIPEVKDLDIETHNFIVPLEIQEKTKLTIPLIVAGQKGNKFRMDVWDELRNFVDTTLNRENLIELAKFKV